VVNLISGARFPLVRGYAWQNTRLWKFKGLPG